MGIFGLTIGASQIGIEKLLSIVVNLFNLPCDSCLSFSNIIFYSLIFSKSLFNFALFYSISSFLFILYELREVIERLKPEESADCICCINKSGSDCWVYGCLRSVMSLS